MRYVPALLFAALLYLAPVAQAQEVMAIHSEKWIVKEYQLRYSSWDEKVEGVNRFINQHPHRILITIDGKSVVPEASLNPFGMDCFYRSAMKILMLERLGIHGTESRLARVRATGKLHSYLVVPAGNNEKVVLDSRYITLRTLAQAEAEYEKVDKWPDHYSFRIRNRLKNADY